MNIRYSLAFLLVDCLFLGLGLGGLRNPWAHALAAAWLWSAALIFSPREFAAAGFWAAYLGWTFLSSLASGEPLIGLAAFSRAAEGVLFFALASSCWRRADRRRWLHALWGAGLVLALAAIEIPSLDYPKVGLLFPYYNYTACVAAAAFAACLASLSAGYPRSRLAQGLILGLMAFLLAFLFWDHSRGGLWACAAGGLICPLRQKRWRLLGLLLAGSVAGFSLATARHGRTYFPIGHGTLVLRPRAVRLISDVLKLNNPAAYVRPEIWKSALMIARDHPWLGEGPGQFQNGFLRHNFPAPPAEGPMRYGLRTAYAHSEPLQIAAETGWPGLILFLCALALSWRRAWRATGATNGSRAEPEREAAHAALGAIAAQALVDNILTLPAMTWLAYSALAAAGPYETNVQQQGGFPWTRAQGGASPYQHASGKALHVGARALCAVGLLLTCLSWWPGWAVDSWSRRALRYSGPESALWAGRALSLAGQDPDRWEDLAHAYLRQTPPQEGPALAALGQASLRNPTNAFYPLMAAEILRAHGRWEQTLLLAEKASQLEPNAPEPRLLRCEALLNLGKEKGARREFSAILVPEKQRALGSGSDYDVMLARYDESRYHTLAKILGKD